MKYSGYDIDSLQGDEPTLKYESEYSKYPDLYEEDFPEEEPDLLSHDFKELS